MATTYRSGPRRDVIRMLLGARFTGSGPPDPVRWQCVVVELAAILHVEPAPIAVDRCDKMLDPLDSLRPAQLPQRFEDAVFAEIERRKWLAEIERQKAARKINW
jgi:hypothetical protein